MTQILLTLALSMVAWNPSAKHLEADRMLAGPQRHSLLVGGSRSGKTTLIVKANILRAMNADESRHVILRQHAIDVRQSVGMDTFPKVMSMRFPEVTYEYNKGDMIFFIRDKTKPRKVHPEVWLAGLDESKRVERILGKEFATLSFNECSQIPYASVVLAHTRLAQAVNRNLPHGAPKGQLPEPLIQRNLYDLNPVGTGHWTYRIFVEGKTPDGRALLTNTDQYRMMYLNPKDNSGNLTQAYIQDLANMPERARKRFFDGLFVAELDGALWTLDVIARNRLTKCEELQLPPMVRIVVAVDPSGASGANDLRADQIGIVVAGIGTDGHGYLLEDLTGLYPPEGWAKIVCEAFWRWAADRVVGEKNFGGDMVRAVIQAHLHPDTGRPVGGSVPYKAVTASRGKSIRMEPVSAIGSTDRIHHVGEFPLLEDELVNFTTSGYLGESSPNRGDAYCWAFSELFEIKSNMGLLDHARQEVDLLRATQQQSRVNPFVEPPAAVSDRKPTMEEWMETLRSIG